MRRRRGYGDRRSWGEERVRGLSRRGWAGVIGLTTAVLLAFVVLPSTVLAGFGSGTDSGAGFATGTFPSYAQAVQSANPLGYYRLDDAAGSTTLADSSSNSNPATLVHTTQTWRLPGSPGGGSDTGRSARFFGSSQTAFLTSTDSISLPAASPAASFELWFRSTSTTGGLLAELADTKTANTGTTDRALSITDAGKVQFTAGGLTITGSATLNDGGWHLVDAVLASGVLQLYVDGSLAASGSYTGSLAMTSGYFRIGGDTTFFTGDIDGVALYAKQLSAASVTSHWSGGTSRTAAAYTSAVNADTPWAFWNLDDDPAGPWGQDDTRYPSSLVDSGPSNHPGLARGLWPASATLQQPGALSGSNAGTSMKVSGSGWAYSTTSMAVLPTFTYEMWIKTTTTTGGGLAIFTSTGPTTCRGVFTKCGRFLSLKDDGRVAFGVSPNSVTTEIVSPTALNDGAWHYLVATVIMPADTSLPAELRLYVDSALAADNANVPRPDVFTGRFAFGGGGMATGTPAPTSASFVGVIDEVAFYGTTLSQSQMSQHWAARVRTS